MPKFQTSLFRSLVVPDGVYIAKVLSTKEKTSEAGNPMIAMKLGLTDRQELPCTLTFVPAAKPVINAFCDSAGLIKPSSGEAELTAADCLGRYVYIVVTNDLSDPCSEPQPRITGFITREAALLKNPKLATITLREQPPRQLRPHTS